MDVNGVGQNAININAYSLNSAVSQYKDTNGETTIQQSQQIETQSSSGNEAENKAYSKSDLNEALNKVNNFLKNEHTHAEYSIHKDFGTLMIKIVDEETKKVILEVPPEKILDMVASMCKQFGLLDKKA